MTSAAIAGPVCAQSLQSTNRDGRLATAAKVAAL